MPTSSKHILQSIIVGIIFAIAFVIYSYFSMSDLVEKMRTEHGAVLTNISTQTATQDIKLFAKQLKASHSYVLLQIKTLNGEQLYSTNSNDNGNGILPNQEKIVTIPERDINVTFQLDISKLEELFISILVVFLIVTSCLLSILVFISQMHKRDALSNQNKSIIKAVESSVNKQEKQFSAGIPEIDKALSSMKTVMSETTSNQKDLEAVAFVDNLTGLPNRSRFIEFIENNSKDEKHAIKFGVLAISRCSELQTINQIHGYHEGDKYISQVAEIISGLLHTYKNAKVFRLNSSDFASLIPNITLSEAENFANQLTAKFNEFQLGSELDSVAFSGMVKFEENKPLGELLALADTAISVAQTLHKNAWYIQKDADILASNSAAFGNQNWRQEIDNVIENHKVKLLTQPIQPIGTSNRLYSEILARFKSDNDEVLPTAPFIAMAEKLDKIIAIDRLIVETAINKIKSHHIADHSFGINLSARSIHDEHFLIWLERKLLKENEVGSQLVFEVTEFGLQQNIKTSKRFIDMIHRAGAKVAVERFGVGLTSFKFFKDLKPDFVKMDGSYTRDIGDDKNNQYFLRLMIDLAHRLSVKVLVESVETLNEKDAMDRLCIDGAQGYFIGRPEPL